MNHLPAIGCPDSNNQPLPPIATIMVENSPGISPQQSRPVSLPAPAAPTFLGYEAHSHAHHFKSPGHFTPYTTLGNPFTLNGSSHAGWRGVLPGQPGSQMPVDHAASVADQILIANGIDLSSQHPQQYGAQEGNRQARTSTVSLWPSPLPRIAQQHKTEAFRFPDETNHRNQGRTHCIDKGRRGSRQKGRMKASSECKKCGRTETCQWRSGFEGEKLCNACGLAYKIALKKSDTRL